MGLFPLSLYKMRKINLNNRSKYTKSADKTEGNKNLIYTKSKQKTEHIKIKKT